MAIWETHLLKAKADGKGRVLSTTKAATILLAEILFAKLDFINSKQDVLPDFIHT